MSMKGFAETLVIHIEKFFNATRYMSNTSRQMGRLRDIVKCFKTLFLQPNANVAESMTGRVFTQGFTGQSQCKELLTPYSLDNRLDQLRGQHLNQIHFGVF